MRKTLVVNSGSSSLKFKIYEMPDYIELTQGVIDRIGIEGSFLKMQYNGEKIIIEKSIENHEEAIALMLETLENNKIISSLEEITKVGHRVVQGGEIFKESALINEKELEQIKELAKLAPLHNGPNAQGIEVFRKLIPTAQNIAVFDTEFHHTLPEESYFYPVPYSWYREYGVRRYGMHGTSHKYITSQMPKLLGKEQKEIKYINLHLGNGASLAAVDAGKSIQTSMGLTPLAGIMMGTRSGDIDPSILEYMQEQTGESLENLTNDLNKKSGLLGISEVSNDFRDILEQIAMGNEQAKLAFKVYVTRIVEVLGSYYFRLGGIDALVFTAGIGENVAKVRASIIEHLEFLGIKLDEEANNKNAQCITTADSKIKVFVIPTEEEYQIAVEAEQF